LLKDVSEGVSALYFKSQEPDENFLSSASMN